MPKAILIEGPASSGKTRLAKTITDGVDSYYTVLINGRQKISDNPFAYSECSVHTKFIIIDDLQLGINSIEDFYNSITDGVEVNQRGYRPFTITPIFIFCCNPSIKLANLKKTISFKNRFEVFKLSNK